MGPPDWAVNITAQRQHEPNTKQPLLPWLLTLLDTSYKLYEHPFQIWLQKYNLKTTSREEATSRASTTHCRLHLGGRSIDCSCISLHIYNCLATNPFACCWAS